MMHLPKQIFTVLPFTLLVTIGACSTVKQPALVIPFDQNMVLSEPVYKRDYEYLEFAVTHKLHQKLNGQLVFKPGGVSSSHNYGAWTLLAVKSVCIKSSNQSTILEIVPSETARKKLISTLILDDKEMHFVTAKLTKLDFNVSCDN